jgi:L,D-transpeptidase ErfK/SrfK
MNFAASTARRSGPALILLALCGCLPALADTLELPDPAAEVVGENRIEFARRSDTLMDIARWTNMGYREIRRANPDVDLWKPGEGTKVLIPSRFVLPDGPRDGILINRAEKRLYYFHLDAETGTNQVTTYPIGIGREGRETPLGSTRITRKLDNPAWYPSDETIADYAERGLELARVVPPGPDNPLGDHALLLDLRGYLLHGTNRPDGVGMRVSQGCVRLYPEHIRDLVERVALGTPVHFVDQAVKLGVHQGRLYLEVHADAEGRGPDPNQANTLIQTWLAENADRLTAPVDREEIRKVLLSADGVARSVVSPD